MTEIDKEIKRIIDERLIFSVFQPIVSLRDCKIAGYEALSRIKGDSLIRNSEDLFYHASVNGMVWRLEQVCRKSTFKALSKQFDSTYKKLLFINVSPGVINDKDFREGFTREYVDKNNINASQIVFELTEHEAISDMSTFLTALEHYKKQMYEIALDDVGSGYSGLGLICDINPQYVKIDMKIIRNIHKNRLQYAIVKSLSDLAEAADFKLIAEGIETAEEMEVLVELGVHYGQGYYFARPSESFLELKKSVGFVCKQVKEANVRYNRTCNYGTDSFRIKNITDTGVTAPMTMRVRELAEMFEENPELFGVTIVCDGKSIGTITRHLLDHKLSGRFGFDLYQNKEVLHIMDNIFLEVDCSDSIKNVADMAMRRQRDAIYDFIVVSKGGEYYGVVTIKELLLKATEIAVFVARDTNPLTGLPGNNIISQEICNCTTCRSSYSIIYIDIDNFKAYNDVYGFSKGDMIIKVLADILKNIAGEMGFVGHIGGDDFIVILGGYEYSAFFKTLSVQFSEKTLPLFSEADRQNGFIIAENRKGAVEQFNLVSLTAAVVTNEKATFGSANEIMKLLTERKKLGKGIVGNSIYGE